jgi:AcrR family transcriptional regulator
MSTQRVRLIAAMVEVIGKHGYRGTTVSQVIESAGVSRKTFYEHFANKQECLLSTHEAIMSAALSRVERAYQDADGRSELAHRAIHALLETASGNPGAVRLAVVEIGAAGPAGVERRARELVRFERVIRAALELVPDEGADSEIVLKAIVGGLNRVLYRRIYRDEREDPLALVPDLVQWATSYYPTPSGIINEPRKALAMDTRASYALEGGRAPGTLAPHLRLSGRRGLVRGDQNVSASFVRYNQRERILDAIANLTAASGYAELKVEAIAREAAVSVHALYELFTGKEDAFLVAYEVGHGKALAAVERAYTAEADWRKGVKAGIAALFRFLASEPAFAHLALVDALTATPVAIERANRGIAAYAQMLVPGLEQPSRDGSQQVTIEAIIGGIFELCLDYALRGRIAELPELTVSATYIALAPFIGAEEGSRIARNPATR